MSPKLLILLLLVIPPFLKAQDTPGARQTALSNSATALQGDIFSIFSNPAGLSAIRTFEAGMVHSPSPYGLNELSSSGAVCAIPVSPGTISLGFSTYGFELFRENSAVIALASAVIKDLSAGLTLRINHLNIRNYGEDFALTISAGTIICLEKDLFLGISVKNLTASTYGSEKNQIPVLFSTGLSYSFSDILFTASIQKEPGFDGTLGFGTEYKPLEFFSFRFGLLSGPERYSAGIGLNHSFLRIDYAVITHDPLGLSHQAAVTFSF